jgi:hypothetical protein
MLPASAWPTHSCSCSPRGPTPFPLLGLTLHYQAQFYLIHQPSSSPAHAQPRGPLSWPHHPLSCYRQEGPTVRVVFNLGPLRYQRLLHSTKSLPSWCSLGSSVASGSCQLIAPALRTYTGGPRPHLRSARTPGN